MIVLYKTKLLDPNGREGWYFGIHQINKSNGIDPMWSKDNPEGYIGSGGLFHTKDDGHIRTLKRGWIHVDTEILEEISFYDLIKERALIQDAWKRYGIHPQVIAWAKSHGIYMPYKERLVLNCQSTSAENLWPSDGRIPPCNTKGALNKKSESLRRAHLNPDYRKHLSEGIKRASLSGFHKKGVQTKKEKYGYIPGFKEAVEAARAPEVRKKAAETRSGSVEQWSCVEYPELGHTSMSQLSIKLGLKTALLCWVYRRGLHSDFEYRNLHIKYLGILKK